MHRCLVLNDLNNIFASIGLSGCLLVRACRFSENNKRLNHEHVPATALLSIKRVWSTDGLDLMHLNVLRFIMNKD